MINYRQTFLRIFAAFMAFILCFGCFQYSDAILGFPLQIGDINLNGNVDTGDAAFLLRYSIGIYELNVYSRLVCDVNGDGLISSGDAALLLQHVILGTNINVDNPALIGNVIDPIYFTDIPYDTVIENNTLNYVPLCEYTAHAIYEPGNNVAFGIGYTVRLEAGSKLILETALINEPLDTKLYIFDTDMNILARDDDSGDASFSRIEFNIESTDYYKILLCGYDEDTIGECYLFMSGESLPPSPPTPISDIEFTNISVPENGSVLQYQRPYSLQGIISASEPITGVRAVITNTDTNQDELTAERFYDELDSVYEVLLRDGVGSIDEQLSFSNLSFGNKRINIYCKTALSEESLIFTGDFFMGATRSLLEGNAFMTDSIPMNAEQMQSVLDLLNSLDPMEIGSQAIMNGFTFLGTPYGTTGNRLDCSLFVKTAYAPCGINLPRTSDAQGLYCYELNGEIPRSELLPGDLIFFTDKDCSEPSCTRFRDIHHVSMYIGSIDGVRYYMESACSLEKVVIRTAWGETPTVRWEIALYGRPY